MLRVRENAQAMAKAFVDRGYDLISGGTDNHMMLVDLRNKNISGKQAEQALVKAEITANKNMVPFDDKSPFVTSGIRFGTAAITTRGLNPLDMEPIVSLIDEVIQQPENEKIIKGVAAQVHKMMAHRPLFNA
jgi:glycine hydroxymethyltransferase